MMKNLLTDPRISRTAKAVAVVCALALAFWFMWVIQSSFNDRKANPDRNRPVVTVRPSVPVNVLPDDDRWEGGTAQPQQVIITPVEWPTQMVGGTQTIIIRDTVRIPVPEAVREQIDSGNVRITSQKPVTVHQPLFGTPSVSLATYNPVTQQYETLVYDVPEHPFKYGVEFEAFLASQLGVTGFGQASPGLGGRIYLGYRTVQGFVGGQYTADNGVEARVGLRYRLGR